MGKFLDRLSLVNILAIEYFVVVFSILKGGLPISQNRSELGWTRISQDIISTVGLPTGGIEIAE